MLAVKVRRGLGLAFCSFRTCRSQDCAELADFPWYLLYFSSALSAVTEIPVRMRPFGLIFYAFGDFPECVITGWALKRHHLPGIIGGYLCHSVNLRSDSFFWEGVK